MTGVLQSHARPSLTDRKNHERTFAPRVTACNAGRQLFRNPAFVDNRHGVATFTTTKLAGGSYVVTASYVGTNNFAGSASATTVPLTLSLTVSNTSTNAVPTGKAAFYLDYGTSGQKLLGNSTVVSGATTFTTKLIPSGSHTVTAIYGGNVNFFAAAPVSVSQTVTPAKTATTLTSDASSSTVTYGTAVTFTATVTDPDTGLTPNGSVQFWDGTTLLATVALNGQGNAFLTKSLARGAHSITAKFVGSSNFNLSLSGAYNYNVS